MAVNQAAMRRRARIMRAANVPMRAALSLPFATPLSGDLMLISYTGRKSGKVYRQPVSYVGNGDVLLTPGGGRWTLNLADPARIRLSGRDAPARPELVLLGVSPKRTRGRLGSSPSRAAPTGVSTPTPSTPHCGMASASCAGTSPSRGDAEEPVRTPAGNLAGAGDAHFANTRQFSWRANKEHP